MLVLIYQTKAVTNNNKQNLLINLPSLQYRLMLLTQTTAIYSSFVCIFHLVEILCRLGSLVLSLSKIEEQGNKVGPTPKASALILLWRDLSHSILVRLAKAVQAFRSAALPSPRTLYKKLRRHIL